MKPISLLLLVLLTVSQTVDAQGVVRRSKPSSTKTQHLDLPATPHRAATASYSDGVLRVGDVSYRMVRVEAGTFTMGATPEQDDPDSGEKPPHSVTLTDDYFIGEHEVTQALWRAVMGHDPSHFDGDDLPVESVSWDDCQAFISRLNELTGRHFRLPTEAEWEYAARGGNNSGGYLFAGSNDPDAVAWFGDNSNQTTHPVKTKLPNELGLYDMTGNVWEWCLDLWARYSNAPQTNPTSSGSAFGPVFRGGSWFSEVWRCRITFRNHCSADYHFDFLGLRLALTE